MAFFSRRKRKANFRPEKEPVVRAPAKKANERPKEEAGQNGGSGRDWQRWRMNFIIGLFCLVWICLWGRAWQLQMIEGPRLADKARRQHVASELVSGRRGLIYDRAGQVLARSVEARSVYANPREVADVDKTAAILAQLLDTDAARLREELSKSSRKFVWLRRKVDDNVAESVRKAALPGIGLTKEYDRFYPFKHMAGQVLGFVGMDDKGLEGIERSLDSRLGAMPVRQIVQRDAMGRRFYLHEEGRGEPVGEDVTLTLDMRIQFFAEEAVARVAKEFEARWAGALVVDVPSGDILAWAQYPFFNPNSYSGVHPGIYRNRLAADALEPGSTFKPFIMAAAIQENKVGPNTLIDCEGGRWERKNFTIRDTSIRGILPASKVLRYSSNIGMAKIGQSVGAHRLYKYLSSLGFGDKNPAPISNSRGILRPPRDWSEIDIMAASFGQSVSVTALQMAQAYLTLLNHGVNKPLRLVLEDSGLVEMPERVFNEKSVSAVLDMMRDVVEAEDGTGKRARIPGMEVGGKTGTAQKADQQAKTYGAKRLASFAGFFPAREPRFLILVFVDEPARNQYGGVVAAPAFKEIASRLMTFAGLLNEPPRQAEALDAKRARRIRGLRMAKAPGLPWQGASAGIVAKSRSMNLPGHLAAPSRLVPDVMGKSVRNAVELFARAGIVPELKGSGGRVVRQSPAPGSPWPKNSDKTNYILWLSER